MHKSSIQSRSAAAIFGALLLSACSAPTEDTAAPEAAETANAASAGEATDAQAGAAPARMPTMTQTGWRVRGEDGAVYTTYLDADGSYRDFKNGDPLQVGTWEERVDGKLCFTPEVEGRIGECWALEPLDGDGMMQPVSDAGKTIDMRQVTYLPPEDEG